MTYKIRVVFAEGVTRHDLWLASKRMGIGDGNMPEGNISHYEAMVDGRLVFTEEWTSKAACEAFIDQIASPVIGAEGIEIDEVEEL